MIGPQQCHTFEAGFRGTQRELHVEAEHADARMTGYVYLNLASRPSRPFRYHNP